MKYGRYALYARVYTVEERNKEIEKYNNGLNDLYYKSYKKYNNYLKETYGSFWKDYCKMKSFDEFKSNAWLYNVKLEYISFNGYTPKEIHSDIVEFFIVDNEYNVRTECIYTPNSNLKYFENYLNDYIKYNNLKHYNIERNTLNV